MTFAASTSLLIKILASAVVHEGVAFHCRTGDDMAQVNQHAGIGCFVHRWGFIRVSVSECCSRRQ